MAAFNKKEARLRRKKRVRKKIKGVSETPRLSVFKSSKHIYAQIIDDTTARPRLCLKTFDQKFMAREAIEKALPSSVNGSPSGH